jgi:aminopeptidase N
MSARARLVLALALLYTGMCAASEAPRLALDIDLDPLSRRLEAVADLTAPGRLEIALHESLAIRAATVAGRPAVIEQVGRRGPTIQWHIEASRGAAVRIEYGGVLPELDLKLDHRDVLRTRSPMAAPAGSFLPAGSGWYPEPAAAFTYSVRMALPSDQRGLVPGRLSAETLPTRASARYVAEFRFDQPTHGIDLMAGPYVVREQLVPRSGLEPLRLRTYFYPDLAPLAEPYLEQSRRFIELYSSRIGAYPYASFSVVASPLPTGFGMPTLTYIGARVLELPFIRETSLGHEILHNWWGNGVYVHYDSGNWAEGLTTFMADYAFKEAESASAARDMRAAWLRDFAAVPEGAREPLTAFRARTHGAATVVGYGKSAMVFLMLRDAIGEAAFSQAIRGFWEKHRFRTASWEHLREAFELASGRSLARFFDQWLQRAGAPHIRIADARLRSAGAERLLALTLVQSTPAYALEVPIELVTASGAEMRRVPIDRERATVELEIGAAVHGVRLDPELRLWRVLEPEELPAVLRRWIIARAPRLALATRGERFAAAAGTVARAFFESPPRSIDLAALAASPEPLLIAGVHADVDAALESLRLPPRPDSLHGRGSAQVWTVQDARVSAPIAIISVGDAAALQAIARPLPHYGRQSYLVFEGSTVIDRGVWPAFSPVVPVRVERSSLSDLTS